MVKILINSGLEIYMDQQLRYALDSLVYNVTSDWDFVIIISGDRMVRIGKSVIAMQIAAYLAFRLKTSFSLQNIFFDSVEMVNAAQSFPKHSVLVYDEGREGLAANKSSQQLQRDLLDYFAECGQLGHIFIVVLPDFFELKENIAIGRSEFLINVYRKSENLMANPYNEPTAIPIVRFDRGFFEFFSRKQKQLLYDIAHAKHQKNYSLVRAGSIGRFTNLYTVSELEYRQKKMAALARFLERKQDEKVTKTDVFRDEQVFKLHCAGLNAPKIVKELEEKYNYTISTRQLHRIIQRLEGAIPAPDCDASAPTLPIKLKPKVEDGSKEVQTSETI